MMLPQMKLQGLHMTGLVSAIFTLGIVFVVLLTCMALLFAAYAITLSIGAVVEIAHVVMQLYTDGDSLTKLAILLTSVYLILCAFFACKRHLKKAVV